MIRKIFVAAACMAVIGLMGQQGLAQRNGQEYLFSQYYTQPGASSAQAEMYPAPHPVPAHVGNSYYTYQPLMPHEFMYSHSRNYYNYHATPEAFYRDMCGSKHYRPGYGLNKTSVRWQSGQSSIGPLPGNMFPFSRLQHHWNSKRNAVPRNAGPLNLGLGQGQGCLSGRCGGGFASRGFGGGSVGGGEVCSNDWSQARQAAVARTAAGLTSSSNLR